MLKSLKTFFQGIEYDVSGVASPNLSGVVSAVNALPPEKQTEYFERFLNDPSWVKKDESY